MLLQQRVNLGISFIINSVFLDKYLKVGLLEHRTVLVLSFWGHFIMLSIVAAPFYIPTNRVQRFQFLYNQAMISIFYYFHNYPTMYTKNNIMPKSIKLLFKNREKSSWRKSWQWNEQILFVTQKSQTLKIFFIF